MFDGHEIVGVGHITVICACGDRTTSYLEHLGKVALEGLVARPRAGHRRRKK